MCHREPAYGFTSTSLNQLCFARTVYGWWGAEEPRCRVCYNTEVLSWQEHRLLQLMRFQKGVHPSSILGYRRTSSAHRWLTVQVITGSLWWLHDYMLGSPLYQLIARLRRETNEGWRTFICIWRVCFLDGNMKRVTIRYYLNHFSWKRWYKNPLQISAIKLCL